MPLRFFFQQPQLGCLTLIFLLLFLCPHAVSSQFTPTGTSEGSPYSPVPIFESYVVLVSNNLNFSDGSSYIAAPTRYAKVDAIVLPGDENPQTSLDDCSRSCAATPECAVFIYSQDSNGCELSIQAEANPERTFPFVVDTSLINPNVTSGAPILSQSIVAPEFTIPGYAFLPAQSYYGEYDYSCDGTLVDGACAMHGTPADVYQACNADARCALIVYYPETSYLGGNVSYFKGNTFVNLSAATLNNRAVSYLKLGNNNVWLLESSASASSGSDSGLSSGAVAGIAIGCAVAGAVVAGGTMLVLAKKRRRMNTSPTTTKNSDASLRQQGQLYSDRDKVSSTSASSRDVYLRNPQQQPKHASPFAVEDTDSPLATHPVHDDLPGGDNDHITTTTAAAAEESEDLPSAVLHPSPENAAIIEAFKASDYARYQCAYSQIKWTLGGDGSRIELGRGAFSIVYKAKLEGSTLLYAAKVIPLPDPRSQRSFLREAVTLFHLRHPNIVNFGAVCVHERTGILLQEFMENGSLFDQLKRTEASANPGRVTGWFKSGRKIVLGVIQALHHLHSLHMIHLDLKSANVLLTKDFTSKLSDVGFTRMWQSLESFGEASASSMQDSRVGTFAYMAPELLLGGSVTPAADMYSFGVLLREVCTGHHPSRGRSRLPLVPDECPQYVQDIIIECMKNEPLDRPSAYDVYTKINGGK